MPGVLKYTPAWLSRPSPGFEVFASKAPPKLSNTEAKQKNEKPFGPQRTIARRGTEVFVAVGNELRWTDMVLLKERYDETQDKQNGQNGNEDDQDDQEDEMGNHNDDQDKETRSNLYHRVSCLVLLLQVAYANTITDTQSTNLETYKTADHVTTGRLPCNSHLKYCSRRRPARFLTPQLGGHISTEPQNVPHRTYYTRARTSTDCFNYMAPASVKWRVSSHCHCGRCRAIVGA